MTKKTFLHGKLKVVVPIYFRTWMLPRVHPGISVYCVVVVQSLSRAALLETPWIAAHQAPLSSAVSRSLLRYTSIGFVVLSNHLILCCLLSLLLSFFPSIRIFPKESALWPKFWSFSFSISPSKEYSGLISFRVDWFDLPVVQGTLKVFSSPTIQRHQFFSAQFSLWSNSHEEP